MSGRTITEADLVSFALLTRDHHPQHTDAAWAAAGPFGERVAHGMLVLSYAVGLVDFDPERVVALRRIKDAVFKRPVRIGDTIDVEVSLQQVASSRGIEAYEWRIVNQRGELVARAVVEAVVREEGTRVAERDDPALQGPPVLL